MTDLSTPAQRRLAYELAAARLRQSLRRAVEAESKAGFNPAQPRNLAGSGRDSGRWARLGAAMGSAASGLRTAVRAGAFGEVAQQAERAVENVAAPLARGAGEVASGLGRTAAGVTAPLRRAREALEAAIAAAPPPVRDFLNANRPALVRAAGALQAAGGAAEGATGVSLLAGSIATAPEGGLLATGAGAWMTIQGYDDFSTGLKTLISGEAHDTGFVTALRGFGFSADEADGIAIATAGLTPAAALRLGERRLEDAVTHALLRDALEPFGPALRLTSDGSFWNEQDIMMRGLAWEAADRRLTGFDELPAGFKTFDQANRRGDIAISNKTLDFERDFYKVSTPQTVRNRLKKMIDDVADWTPEKTNRANPRLDKLRERRLHLLVPSQRTTPGQAAQIAAARAYARSKGVVFTVRHGR